MVGFMLYTSCEQSVTFEGVLYTIQVLIGHDDSFRAGNICIDAWKRQAAFLVVIFITG